PPLSPLFVRSFLFFFTTPPPPELYPLSLHDALPISASPSPSSGTRPRSPRPASTRSRRSSRSAGSGTSTSRRTLPDGNRGTARRSEEHTSELQSLTNLVSPLLLQKKKTNNTIIHIHS